MLLNGVDRSYIVKESERMREKERGREREEERETGRDKTKKSGMEVRHMF